MEYINCPWVHSVVLWDIQTRYMGYIYVSLWESSTILPGKNVLTYIFENAKILER